ARLAPLRPPVPLMRQVGEVGVPLCRADDHTPTMPAIAPIGPTPRRVLLPPKAQAAIAPGAPRYEDRHAVDEHGAQRSTESVSARAPQPSARDLPPLVRGGRGGRAFDLTSLPGNGPFSDTL